jgi:hypothetical protein
MTRTKSFSEISWILFFYTVPSKPVRNRVTIWRKLLKAGALLFKGSVYILPDSEDNYELLSWLVSEVASLKGEAAFLRVDKIETIDNLQIITLFNENREIDYQRILKGIEEIERKISSTRIGGASQNTKIIADQIKKYQRDYEEIKKIDFFASKKGLELQERLDKIKPMIKGLSETEGKKQLVSISPARIDDYQHKTWLTRKKPFVDRFASAWLIKKFIDKNPSFTFIDEKDLDTKVKDVTSFDIRGGRFTHAGDLCTFEVLMKSFSLKDKTLRKIAEIVHELDLKDDKFRNPEAKGIEDILSGIRKTTKDDHESLEKGISIFEMLYESKA